MNVNKYAQQAACRLVGSASPQQAHTGAILALSPWCPSLTCHAYSHPVRTTSSGGAVLVFVSAELFAALSPACTSRRCHLAVLDPWWRWSLSLFACFTLAWAPCKCAKTRSANIMAGALPRYGLIKRSMAVCPPTRRPLWLCSTPQTLRGSGRQWKHGCAMRELNRCRRCSSRGTRTASCCVRARPSS